MKKRTRYLLVLATAALVALALAAPVVAHQLSVRGMSGTLPLYTATPYEGAKVDSHDIQGTLWFDMTIDPYKVKYVVTAHHLDKRTRYALVNIFAHDDSKHFHVNVLDDATSTRRGTLSLRGSAGLSDIKEFSPDPWVSGAQIGLFKYSDIKTIDGKTYVHEDAQVLFGLAGLPIVLYKAK